MATAATLLPMAVPGLHGVLTKAELEEATTRYNALPPDDDNLPKIPDHIRDGAQQLIEKFGVTNKFCFHLLHGHDKLEKGTVMHGQRTTSFNGEGIWSRPTPIDQLDLANMRGQIWTLDAAAGTFQPYEFRAGPPEPMTANDNAFVAAFKDFLTGHGACRPSGSSGAGRPGARLPAPQLPQLRKHRPVNEVVGASPDGGSAVLARSVDVRDSAVGASSNA